MTREEAIEVYNNLINQKIKEAFEFFAPELRESEDEKIRKALISAVKKYDTVDGIEQEKVLAYLEKQKEPTLREFIEDFPYGEQKEQKPMSILTKDDSTYTAYCKGQNDVIENPKAYGLCKPAEWSEEDEKTRNSIIEAIHNLWPYEHRDKCIQWLKSIRPQPKQECKDCKEYEKGYQQGHQEGHTLGYNDGYKKATEEYNKHTSYHFPTPCYTSPCYEGGPCINPQTDCINCPRRTTGGFTASPNTITTTCTLWKPSEEELTSLKKVVFNRPIGSEEMDILETLYDNLKEL